MQVTWTWLPCHTCKGSLLPKRPVRAAVCGFVPGSKRALLEWLHAAGTAVAHLHVSSRSSRCNGAAISACLLLAGRPLGGAGMLPEFVA